MNIYIASSWKNQHAVEMLTSLLRGLGHKVLSFIENNHGENHLHPHIDFEEWCATPAAQSAFEYDTSGATGCDLVIYLGPSGTDAWAEVGAAWAAKKPIYGLFAKGEQSGLMRKMVTWFHNYDDLLKALDYASTFRS